MLCIKFCGKLCSIIYNRYLLSQVIFENGLYCLTKKIRPAERPLALPGPFTGYVIFEWSLVSRCNKLIALNLGFFELTNNSIKKIIEYLKSSLEELQVSRAKIDFECPEALKSLTRLRIFNCCVLNSEEIRGLKKHIPSLECVNSTGALNIALFRTIY